MIISHLIKNEEEYDAIMVRVEELFNCAVGTPEGDELELLLVLVEHYEDIHYPMGLPDPISAIRFRMDQQNLKPKDLIPYIGSKRKVAEVLSGKRPLSLKMMRKLVQGLGIAAEVFAQELNKPA